MDLDKLFILLQNKETKFGYASFNEKEKLFIELMLLWYEVGNGGLRQYYENTESDVLVIPKLLNTIGANNLSDLLQVINEKFEFNKENITNQKQTELLMKNCDKFEDLLNDFDQTMNDQDEEDIEELLIKYIEDNKEAFE
jgi:hypothetical protein